MHNYYHTKTTKPHKQGLHRIFLSQIFCFFLCKYCHYPTNIEHKLHDYRVDGLDAQFLQQAEAQFGWDNLVNKRSTTWRNLDEKVKNTLSKSTALSVLAKNPTLIKRPIILQDEKALIGFNEKEYIAAFK